MRVMYKLSFWLIVLGWLGFAWMCMWGRDMPDKVSTAIFLVGLICALTGSMFYILSPTTVDPKHIESEKRRLNETVALYADAKKKLEDENAILKHDMALMMGEKVQYKLAENSPEYARMHVQLYEARAEIARLEEILIIHQLKRDK
jgi:hypothetical protein